MKHLLYLAFIILFATSCKTTNIMVQSKAERKMEKDTLDSTFTYSGNYQYKIRKDDKIAISVWGQDELSVGSCYGIYNSNEVYGKWLMVDQNGNIEMPKLGTMNVLDFTMIQLKDTLKKSYAKWILNPVVDIKILNREISVLGEVRNPQVFTIDKENNNLLEMITRSGGLEFYANAKYIKILRQMGENVKMTTVDITKADDYLSKNIQLHPGDIVVVPSKRYKEFDKRISVIIPFTTTVSAAAILLSLF